MIDDVVVRIISLVPSVTETLSSWGHPPIACTRFCERPDIEHVGGTKDPDVVRIVQLRPDLVVVDAEENRLEDYDALVGRGVNVFALHVRSLYEVDKSMTDLADRVGANWTRLALGDPRPARARAFIPIWRRPWIALGTPTYGASLLAHLGVANVFDAGERYPEVELADVVSRGAALFKVRVRGTQMHSSLSDRLPAINATVHMARLLDRMELPPGAPERMWPPELFLERLFLQLAPRSDTGGPPPLPAPGPYTGPSAPPPWTP